MEIQTEQNTQGYRGWLHGVRRTAAKWLAPEAFVSPIQPAPHSPYKDSSQIGITAETVIRSGDFKEGGYDGVLAKGDTDKRIIRLGTGPSLTKMLKAEFEAGWNLVSIGPVPERPILAFGSTRVHQSFKPHKAIVTEILTATFSKRGRPDEVRCASISDAADVVLIWAFSGADNCFPSAPSVDSGIAGPVFSNNSLGNGISWPVVRGGLDFSIGIAIEQSVLYQVTPPDGYTADDLARVHVKVRLHLLGQVQR